MELKDFLSKLKNELILLKESIITEREKLLKKEKDKEELNKKLIELKTTKVKTAQDIQQLNQKNKVLDYEIDAINTKLKIAENNELIKMEIQLLSNMLGLY